MHLKWGLLVIVLLTEISSFPGKIYPSKVVEIFKEQLQNEDLKTL